MKFMNNYYFRLTDYTVFGFYSNERHFKIKFYSDELIACEPILRVLETPGLSVNINIVKSNLSLTIGPFETKDYI